jgi:hypothetical protein
VRPHPAATGGEGRLEERAPVAGAAVVGVDDELDGGVVLAGPGDLGVPDEVLARLPEQVDDAGPGPGEREGEGLRDGGDAVGLLGAGPQRPGPVGGGGVERVGVTGRGDQGSTSERLSATSGTYR